MYGLNVTVGTQYTDDELTAVAHATSLISDALGESGYIQYANTYGGGNQQIGVGFELIVEDVGFAETHLNTEPAVESFEEFGFAEVEA